MRHKKRARAICSMWVLLCSFCFNISMPFFPGVSMQSTAGNPLGVYDSSTALWLQGKGQQVQTEQENPDIKSEPSAALMTGRTEEFNRQLREHPSDTQLWIKFIKFQVKRLTLYITLDWNFAVLNLRSIL